MRKSAPIIPVTLVLIIGIPSPALQEDGRYFPEPHRWERVEPEFCESR